MGDHAVFSPTLIKLLGRIGADMTLDAWTGVRVLQTR